MSKAYLEVFSIRNYNKDNEEKSFWTRVGTAYENQDKSFNVLLDLLPMPDRATGRIHLHLRPPRVRDDVQSTRQSQPSAMDENFSFSSYSGDYPTDYPLEQL